MLKSCKLFLFLLLRLTCVSKYCFQNHTTDCCLLKSISAHGSYDIQDIHFLQFWIYSLEEIFFFKLCILSNVYLMKYSTYRQKKNCQTSSSKVMCFGSGMLVFSVVLVTTETGVHQI